MIETESNQQIPRQKVEEHEKTRDRNSYRLIEVFELPEKLDQKWIGAGCVIKVERSGTRGNEPNQTYQLLSLFFITSISPFPMADFILTTGDLAMFNPSFGI